jgi:hypothetical protein
MNVTLHQAGLAEPVDATRGLKLDHGKADISISNAGRGRRITDIL